MSAGEHYLSFRMSQIAPEHLGHVLNDYLAYERAEMLRRRLVSTLCIVGVLLAVADLITRTAGPAAVTAIAAGLVSIAVVAWVHEIRMVGRLRRRLVRAGIRKS